MGIACIGQTGIGLGMHGARELDNIWLSFEQGENCLLNTIEHSFN